jgi:hypothetical protein
LRAELNVVEGIRLQTRRAGGVSAESEEDNDDEDGDSELEELLERLLL